ncbi:MAG: hypothetical protein ACRCVT_00820 [Leadbetterella sp.]
MKSVNSFGTSPIYRDRLSSRPQVGGNIMKHEMGKDNLIQKFGIKEQIDISFRTILNENTAED